MKAPRPSAGVERRQRVFAYDAADPPAIVVEAGETVALMTVRVAMDRQLFETLASGPAEA